MAGSVAMSGNDTLKINTRSLVDLGDGDVGVLAFPNKLVNVSRGKNGNSLFAFNFKGGQATQTLMVLRGSPDDKFLQSLLTQMENDFVHFVLLTGQFIKVIGDGLGGVANDTYLMNGGVISSRVDAKSNAEGDTKQDMAEYKLDWANAVRVIA